MVIPWMYKLIYIFLVFFIWSCGIENNDKSAKNKLPFSEDTLQHNYLYFREISHYFTLRNDTIDTAFYSIKYPQFSINKYNDILRSYILIEGENNAQEAAGSFIMGYNEFVEDEATIQHHFAWYRKIECLITMNTPLFFSMKNKLSEYTGGAHGNNYVFWSNFDILKAEKIELNDILAKNKQEELTKIAERYFREADSIQDTTSLDSSYFFEDGKFKLNDNFGFTDNHLVFYYNEYEIKPYSEGTTEIRIPYQKIHGLLNIRGKQYIESIKKN